MKTKTLIWLLILIVLISGCVQETGIFGEEGGIEIVQITGEDSEKSDCPYECCVDDKYKTKECPENYKCKENKCFEVFEDAEDEHDELKRPINCDKWCENNPGICPEDEKVYIADTSGKPNIVLIYVDTIRADHLKSYGYERETSPNIDKLADDGVLFLNNISQGPTDLPAIPSFVTSLYPANYEFNYPDKPLSSELTTFAEVLKENGYETAAFISGKPWFFEGGYGLMQGFDTLNTEHERIQEDVLCWLDRNQRKPFLLMVQYAFTHGPYDAPEPYKKMFVEDEYYDKYPDAPGICDEDWKGFGCIPGIVAEDGILDIDYYIAKMDGELRYTDFLVAEVVTAIENMGIADDTILIFTGDHGESLGAHNTFFTHQFLYDDTIKPPLIIKYPSKIPKNKIITNQVQSIDLYPTLLDLVDIPLLVDIDGISLMPLIDGTSNRECNAFSFEGDWSAIRTKKWKYLLYIDGKGIDGKYIDGEYVYREEKTDELYDLESDPYELTNILSQNPEIAEQLRNKVESCTQGSCPSDCE